MEDWLFWISVVLSIPVLSISVSILCIAGYTRLRRKGYRPPGASLILLCAAAAGLLSALAALPWVVLDTGSDRIFFVVTWLPAIVSVATGALLLRVLPRRNARVSGARRPGFPFKVAGFALIGIGVVFVVWEVWKGDDPGDSFKILAILAGFGFGSIAVGKRVKSSSTMETATATDARAPVLYLRPFAQEGLPFVRGKKSVVATYLSDAQRAITAGDSETDVTVSVRFEQYLHEAFKARIGPLVALGNPEDYIPPDGSARTYAKDSEWKTYVEQLATACCCMVAEIGVSDNLKWELQHLRQQGFQKKFFIMTPPVALKVNWLDKLVLWARQCKFVRWDAFVEIMTASGYEIQGDPGPGSVLTFDEAGRAVILKTRAKSPQEYVAPVREFLEVHAGYSPDGLDLASAFASEPRASTLDSSPATTLKAVAKRHPFLRASWTLPKTALVILVLIACVVVPVLVKDYRETSRTQALEALAPQMGFTFTPQDRSFHDADLGGTRLIDNWDSNGAVLNEMEGTMNGHPARIFDYQYEIASEDSTGQKETRKIVQTVAVFANLDRKLPSFDLQEYSLGHALSLSPNLAAMRVVIPEAPEFSKRFLLLSNDQASAKRLFSTPLRQFLTNAYPQGDWSFEGNGSWLMLYQARVRVKPENWPSFLRDTSRFTSDFLQHASAAASSQAATAK